MDKTDNTVKIIRHVTLVGFWINAALVALKLSVGYWGHSDALVADGYHSLSDFVTDFIVLYFVAVAYKKADSDHPYGHGKYETLASVLIGLILMIVAAFICISGIATVINVSNGEVLPRPDAWTIVVAVVSIVAKEFCYRYTVKAGNSINSSSLKANAWHHRSDALTSIATVIGVSLAYFLGEHWRVLDPIVSVLISIFIAISAFQIIRPTFRELLEGALPEEQIEQIRNVIAHVDGVERVHNLRSRRNGHSYIVDVNIHVAPDLTVRQAHKIATEVEHRLQSRFGRDMIIYVHIEPENP